MDTVIRQAEVKDASGIAKIHVRTWQCVYRGQLPNSYLDSLSIEERTEGWKKQLKNPKKGERSFVIEVNGRVVGWCTVGISRDEDATKEVGELYGIYILPNYMGKGLGSKLMKYALSVLRKDGYKKATLWVLDTNEMTRKWYEFKGWKIEGKIKVDVRESVELHETRYMIDLP